MFPIEQKAFIVHSRLLKFIEIFNHFFAFPKVINESQSSVRVENLLFPISHKAGLSFKILLQYSCISFLIPKLLTKVKSSVPVENLVFFLLNKCIANSGFSSKYVFLYMCYHSSGFVTIVIEQPICMYKGTYGKTTYLISSCILKPELRT